MGKAMAAAPPPPPTTARTEQSYAFGQRGGYGFGYEQKGYGQSSSGATYRYRSTDDGLLGPIGYVLLGSMLFGDD